jgi:hypothetical protein
MCLRWRLESGRCRSRSEFGSWWIGGFGLNGSGSGRSRGGGRRRRGWEGSWFWSRRDSFGFGRLRGYRGWRSKFLRFRSGSRLGWGYVNTVRLGHLWGSRLNRDLGLRSWSIDNRRNIGNWFLLRSGDSSISGYFLAFLWIFFISRIFLL